MFSVEVSRRDLWLSTSLTIRSDDRVESGVCVVFPEAFEGGEVVFDGVGVPIVNASKATNLFLG